MMENSELNIEQWGHDGTLRQTINNKQWGHIETGTTEAMVEEKNLEQLTLWWWQPLPVAAHQCITRLTFTPTQYVLKLRFCTGVYCSFQLVFLKSWWVCEKELNEC